MAHPAVADQKNALTHPQGLGVADQAASLLSPRDRGCSILRHILSSRWRFSLHSLLTHDAVLHKRLLVQHFGRSSASIPLGMPLAPMTLHTPTSGGAVMTCNVGGVERPIRIVVGIVVIAVGAFGSLPPAATAIALVVGTIALVTGAIGYCPLWALLGLNTCPAQPPRKA